MESVVEILLDPSAAAEEAGLRYVSDSAPGIRRLRSGTGFRYVDSRGRPVRCHQTLARIRALVLPPAWKDVWICASPSGHLQATGRDARGRKQYRYHERWRTARDETKYSKMIAFGHALPRLRRRVDKELALPGLPRAKVLATIVRLLETTLIRVGNEEYARQNASFGLTTLRTRHVAVKGSHLRFQFKGKSGVRHAVDLKDRRLAAIVKRCQELPGAELFQYLSEDGELCSVSSQDVNDYLRGLCGEEFTAKDFRTWAGTVLAASELRARPQGVSATAAKRFVLEAVTCVSARLGNTKAVCRKCYIHPVVLDAYCEGTLASELARAAAGGRQRGLSADEAAVLAFLKNQIKSEVRKAG